MNIKNLAAVFYIDIVEEQQSKVFLGCYNIWRVLKYEESSDYYIQRYGISR